ncbi:MAG: endonuclease [Candidatus Aenigmatarchaeota archaeon]|nr:MAG: endonuclease [Candidatus Aenigmarchaeota archaeon]
MLDYVILVLILIIVIIICWKLLEQNRKLRFEKKSLSSKYGKMTEQFLPFLKGYPYNEQNFRFIGSPIDGIQFEDDKIIIVEFKVGDSKLTEKQKRVKDLVEKKKVRFEEIRM